MTGTALPADRFSGVIARLLGMFLLLGGIGEFVGAIGHAHVNELLGVLHNDTIIRAWVGVQAIASTLLGGRLLRSAGGVTRKDPAATRRVRAALLAFLGLVVISQLLLAWRLYPHLLQAPPPEPFPGFWVLSLAAAPVVPAALTALLLARLRVTRWAARARVSHRPKAPADASDPPRHRDH